jgi:tripartite-type tricarboxylate transporter receptor subunit TctC
LIAAAKATPSGLNFGSAGIGSAAHLAAERLRISAGFEAQHVPFRGAAEVMTEILTGRIDFALAPLAPALPHIREGRLLALAVSSSKRAIDLPEVPTIAEAGVADAAYSFWVGLFVPAGSPNEIILRLHKEIDSALQMPPVKERLAKLGAEPMPMSIEEFNRYFRDDVEANVRLMKAANIVTPP